MIKVKVILKSGSYTPNQNDFISSSCTYIFFCASAETKDVPMDNGVVKVGKERTGLGLCRANSYSFISSFATKSIRTLFALDEKVFALGMEAPRERGSLMDLPTGPLGDDFLRAIRESLTHSRGH